MRRWSWRWAAVAALAICACDAGPGSDPEPTTLSVLAASSLTEASQALARAFEVRLDSGVRVAITTAGSQALRLQVEQGAKADVFASANWAHMRALERAGLVSDPTTFARGELALIVPPENPAGLTAFADLPSAKRIVIGAPSVPVGEYTRTLFAKAAMVHGEAFADALRDNVVSQEPNVRLVAAKVALGEADAAIVYRTDGNAIDGVHSLAIPENLNVPVRFPIAAITRSPQRKLAQRFIDFVRSARGRRVLREHGFVPEDA